MVVTAGFTDGLARVDENPAGTEIQLYVLPVTAVAPNIVLCPAQIARSLPANAAGNGFTVTTTLLLLVHPVAVIVSVTVYVVVTAGLTDGFASVDVKPAGTELQLYDTSCHCCCSYYSALSRTDDSGSPCYSCR